ncbi:MAG: NTP transferase domain-containing protein [Sedimentisphaerales bacterium]|nr:NTP transferase domain-containing protein [Sedimentisphaerales bacterium]
MSPDNIDVLILVGGQGKRLRQVVGDRPKPLADINGLPFLDILIRYVTGYGFRRIILCTGYMGARVREYYRARTDDVEILFSEEQAPLGTGGAIKNAEALVRSSPFLVMNGDSFCSANLEHFVTFHQEKNARLSIVLAYSDKQEDYGSVTLDSSRRITRFSEKVPCADQSIINAGIYLMNEDVFASMPRKRRFSLEYELFPEIVSDRCYGFVSEWPITDIGTPERYEAAKRLLSTQQFQ